MGVGEFRFVINSIGGFIDEENQFEIRYRFCINDAVVGTALSSSFEHMLYKKFAPMDTQSTN